MTAICDFNTVVPRRAPLSSMTRRRFFSSLSHDAAHVAAMSAARAIMTAVRGRLHPAGEIPARQVVAVMLSQPAHSVVTSMKTHGRKVVRA